MMMLYGEKAADASRIRSCRPFANYCLKTDEGEVILVESVGVRYPPGMEGV